MPITTKLEQNNNIGTLWLVYQGEKKLQLAKIFCEPSLPEAYVWLELSSVFGPWLRSWSTDLGTVKSWNDVELIGQNFVAYLNDLEIMLQWTQR